MSGQTIIDDPGTDSDDPVAEEVEPQCEFPDHLDDSPDLDAVAGQAVADEDETDVPSLTFFPTIPRPARKIAIGPVPIHPSLVALVVSPVFLATVISVVVHVNVGVAVYWLMRHVFVPAHSQPVRGDGAAALGAMEHEGNDQAPGAAGEGSIQLAWSAPTLPGDSAQPRDEIPPPDTDDAPVPPASAPPPIAAFPVDPLDQDVSPVTAMDALPDAAQADVLPRFPRHLPIAAETQPSPATQPAADATAIALAGASRSTPAADQAMVAGFSTPARDDPGGLLHRPGAGGSNGKGGATTGDGGNAVSGRPGSPAGVKGPPIHIDYPEYCRVHGETGVVLIDIDVCADGSIASLKVVDDAGHPRLARAALDKLEGREFYPGTLNGQPVRSTVRYPVDFSLR